ncbi:MAG TPA: hypothetical protein ENN17_03435 [bacterium]|nr:hypothetical protein [bacterium]
MFSAYQFGTISLFLFLSVLFALFLAVLLTKRRNSPGAICLVFLELAVAVWTFAVIFEYATDQAVLKYFWSRVAYLGTTTAPVFYFLFVMAFVRQKRFGNPWLTASFFIVPVITFFLALTNQHHHLIWTQVSVIPESRLAIYAYGPWFWVFVSYCYLMFIVGSLFLIINVFHYHGIFTGYNFWRC